MWNIDLDNQVSCFTVDNGSNTVQSLKDNLNKMHVYNLSAETELKEKTLSIAIA